MNLTKKSILKTLAFPLLGTSLLLPTITLTSCSTVSQYLIPVATKNPFGSINLNDPYAAKGRYDDTTSVSSTNVHLPSSYIYTSSYNTSYQASVSGQYGYTSAITPTWSYDSNIDLSKTNPYLYSQNQVNTYGWYSTGDDAIQYSSGSGLKSYENLINYSAIFGVNTISADLVSLMDYIYIYLNEIISQPGADNVDKLLSVALTNSSNGFDHGSADIGSQQNIDFYQFLLSNANVIANGNSAYKFGTYQVDWTVKDSPIDSYNPNSIFIPLNTTYDLSSKYGEPSDSSQAFIIPTNESYVGTYAWNEENNSYDWMQASSMSPYCKYTYDDDGKPVDISGIANVPILIHLNSLDSSFYNPSKNLSSIQPTDWVNTDTEGVSKAISNSKSWNQFVKQNKVSSDVTNLSSTNTSLDLSSTTSAFNYSDWWFKDFDSTKIDPTVKKWVDNNEISAGDFVILANYSFITIDIQYKFLVDGSENTTHFKTKIPYFSGFSGFYPAYMLFTSQDAYIKVNDSDDNSSYCINADSNSYLYNMLSDAISHLTEHKFETEPKNYTSNNDAFINNPNMLLYWIFATNVTDYKSGTTINTTNWF